MAARRRPLAPHQPEMGQAGHDGHNGSLTGGHGSHGRHGSGAAAKENDTARMQRGRFGTTAALLAWLALVVVRACRATPRRPAGYLRTKSLSLDANAACVASLRAWPL